MKRAEAVMEAMSFIDEAYLAQSEEPKRRFAWKPVLSFAAVFSLLLAVILNLPAGHDSFGGALNSSQTSYTESAEEEISGMLDGIRETVHYDDDLLAYLETVSDDTMVSVIVEKVSWEAKGALEEDMAAAEAADAQWMSKAEILNYEPEPGMMYIFHLCTEDEME